jgi:4-amino-4-deoxy-L-arabinose transferase-like glycosyltransferase
VNTPSPLKTNLRDILVLLLLLGIFFALFLGSRPLSVPDEGRYVEIPREMTVTGDWITPRLNGVKYFEKPPLFYWVEAVLISLFGLGEWPVRLGPALFALFGCVAVYYAGARLFGRRAGVLSSIVLATSVLYYALSRLITLDMPVSVLLTASLLSFLLGTREPDGPKRRVLMYGFYAFAGLAVMTKGLIGAAFPALIIGAWIVVMQEWRLLRRMYLPTGILLFLAVTVPWHVLVSLANPEFPRFYFIHEHFERYLTKVHSRYKPFWYFFPVLLLGFFPWTAFLVQSLRDALPPSWKDRRQHGPALFLLLWAVLIFLFFSASSSKLMPYLLPVLPPLSLLTGRYLANLRLPDDRTSFRAGAFGVAGMTLLLVAGLLLLPRFRPEIDLHVFRNHLLIIAVVLLIGIGSFLSLARKDRMREAIIALAVTASLFPVVTGSAFPDLDTRSVKDLALALRPRLTPTDEVVSYRTYYQDLPVYLERRIAIVEWKGELEFGSTVEDTGNWLISEEEFWKRWDGPQTLYAVASNRNFDTSWISAGKRYFVIARNESNVLLSNRDTMP